MEHEHNHRKHNHKSECMCGNHNELCCKNEETESNNYENHDADCGCGEHQDSCPTCGKHEGDCTCCNNGDDGCACCHHHEQLGKGTLIAGIILFAIGMFLPYKIIADILFVAAYILCGKGVIIAALKNATKGVLFDENFLMTVATICAFAIGEFPEGAAVMIFYRIGEEMEQYAVSGSVKSIKKLLQIRPDFVTVIRNGEQVKCKPEEVLVGETIFVKVGEKIPLDGKILSGESSLDTSSVTGEAEPLKVKAGFDVLSGCLNKSAAITIKATAPYNKSTVAKIIEITEKARARKASPEKFISSFSKYYTPIVCVTAVIVAVVPPLVFNGVWNDWIHRALVFMVVSCPCALVLSVPIAYFGAIGGLSKRGILVKGGNTIESIAKLHTIAFDKTGTLTTGAPTVRGVVPVDGMSEKELLMIAAEAETGSNHPIAKAILAAVPDFVPSADEGKIYKEIPGLGVQCSLGKREIFVGSAEFLKNYKIPFFSAKNGDTIVYVALNDEFVGVIPVTDGVRSGAKTAIAELRECGVQKTVLLTGDCEEAASAVAGIVGIDEYYAKLLPHQKAEKMERILRKIPKGTTAAFVGDGINDAPVIATADVGIAIGGIGSDVAIEAADAVIMTDRLECISQAIKLAKLTHSVVVQNISLAIAVKMVIMVLAMFGFASMWLAVFADTGMAILAVLNSLRVMK